MPPKKAAKKATPPKAGTDEPVEQPLADEAPAVADKPKPAKRNRTESAITKEKSDGPEASGGDEQPSESKVTRRASSGGPVFTEEMIYNGTTDFCRKTKDSDFDPKTMLRIISWNVAGLRAFVGKADLEKFVATEKPDVLCLQETKLSDWADCQKIGPIKGYTCADSISTAKKGYAGTRTYVKEGVKYVHQFGFDFAKPTVHDVEGRVVCTVLPDAGNLTIVNSYVPNAGMTLERLDYRVDDFDVMMRKYLESLPHKGGVIWTGDLNVAERDYDRFWGGNFKAMQKTPGFTPQERQSFRNTLASHSLIDAFRHLYPTAAKAGTYTFYSARFGQRAKGNGWRLDYFVLSKALADRVVDCFPLQNYTESDHQPLVLWLKK
jgi:AP endonuclease-1